MTKPWKQTPLRHESLRSLRLGLQACFERGVIRAQVYNLHNLKTHKNETALNTAVRLRVGGKYEAVDDGDIMHFCSMCSCKK